jgi:hypothetical protein
VVRSTLSLTAVAGPDDWKSSDYKPSRNILFLKNEMSAILALCREADGAAALMMARESLNRWGPLKMERRAALAGRGVATEGLIEWERVALPIPRRMQSIRSSGVVLRTTPSPASREKGR